jgi:hypothetical protein
MRASIASTRASPTKVNARLTLDNFLRDPMLSRIERAIVASGKVIAPVEVLVRMDILAPKSVGDWRFGRVPYLERVIRGSLSRLSRLLHILGYHCHDLNLVPSQTAYLTWGEGRYARHFGWPGRGRSIRRARNRTRRHE